MKTARIINAAIWTAIGTLVCVLVCLQWTKQGCGPESLLAALLFYGSLSTGFALVIDNTIKEHHNN